MSDLWLAVRAVHVLAMALFVGGQLFLVVALVPVERRNPDRERLRAVARRFARASLAAIGVLLVTGAALASHEDRWDDGTLHVKLALVALVGALTVLHVRRPANHALEGLVFAGSLAIVWLGLTLAHG